MIKYWPLISHANGRGHVDSDTTYRRVTGCRDVLLLLIFIKVFHGPSVLIERRILPPVTNSFSL